jgi:hypothetical protein
MERGAENLADGDGEAASIGSEVITSPSAREPRDT